MKEVADSTRYGATTDSLCNEELAQELMALREGNSALEWAATRPEDITPAVAVAVGHFVQVGFAPGEGPGIDGRSGDHSVLIRGLSRAERLPGRSADQFQNCLEVLVSSVPQPLED